MRQLPQWRRHPAEVFVKIRGERHYLWRAIDHEGDVPFPAHAKSAKVRFNPCASIQSLQL
ncbi:DDE-type integrase/transposase/recombinase [Henriciella sp. AS95]